MRTEANELGINKPPNQTPFQAPLFMNPERVIHPILHPLAHLRKSHRLLNLRNGLSRIQPLRTSPRTVQNGMASIQTHTVIQHRLPLRLVFVTAVCEPAVGLQENSGTEVFFAVPPVGGAGRGAAGAENAFVETVELLTVGGRLAVFEALVIKLVSCDCVDGGKRGCTSSDLVSRWR